LAKASHSSTCLRRTDSPNIARVSSGFSLRGLPRIHLFPGGTAICRDHGALPPRSRALRLVLDSYNPRRPDIAAPLRLPWIQCGPRSRRPNRGSTRLTVSGLLRGRSPVWRASLERIRPYGTNHDKKLDSVFFPSGCPCTERRLACIRAERGEPGFASA